MMGEYKPIYPLLADYWDKPLAELPGDLIPIVTALFFALDWDDADMDERQERIKGYDQLKGPANEADTWAALYLYLPYDECRDMGLWAVIAQAKRDGKDSVVAVLTDIAEEILAIATENYPTDGIQSVLWPALYRLSLSLAARREEAMRGKDYQLANALDDVAVQFVRILDIDRERVGDAVDAEFTQKCTAESNVDAAPVRIIRQRCDEILAWLRSNGHNPLMLIPPEKKGLSTVKAICRTALCQNKKMFSSRSLFDKAWQQLRDDKEVSESK